MKTALQPSGEEAALLFVHFKENGMSEVLTAGVLKGVSVHFVHGPICSLMFVLSSVIC